MSVGASSVIILTPAVVYPDPAAVTLIAVILPAAIVAVAVAPVPSPYICIPGIA